MGKQEDIVEGSVLHDEKWRVDALRKSGRHLLTASLGSLTIFLFLGGLLLWITERWEVAFVLGGIPFAVVPIVVGVRSFHRVEAIRHEAKGILEESDSLAVETLDALNSQVAVLDSHGRILFVNRAWRCSQGQASQLKLGDSLPHWISTHRSEDCRRFATILDRALSGEAEDVTVQAAEGDQWFSCRIARYEVNGRARVVFSRENITAEKIAQKALEHRERLLSSTLDTALDAIISTSSEGIILDWNRMAEEIFGFSRDEAVGRDFSELVVPEIYRPIFRKGLRHFSKFANRRLNLVAARAEGVAFPVELTLTRVELGDGAIFTAFVRDVTEQEKAERTKSQLASVVESSRDAIMSLSLSGVVETWNESSERIYGVPASQIIGKPILTILPAERRRSVRSGFRRVARGQHVSLVEYCRERPGGSAVWIEVSLSPIKDKAGNVTGISAICRDISEFKRAEEALSAKEAADRANRAKSEFLSRMSHELRTPLNSVLGFAQLLEIQCADNRVLESVHQIEKAGKHLLNLINEVLDIARIESGRMVLNTERFDLRLAIDEAMDTIGPMARDKGVAVAHRRSAEALIVKADRRRTYQVLLNLLSNAVKYNRPDGSVSILLAVKDASRCMVTVTDTGPGMPLDRIERLFTPFERFDAEKGRIEGTGLGLAVSKRFAEAMGGNLTLASTGPDGSAICLEIPLGAVERSTPQIEPVQTSEKAS